MRPSPIVPFCSPVPQGGQNGGKSKARTETIGSQPDRRARPGAVAWAFVVNFRPTLTKIEGYTYEHISRGPALRGPHAPQIAGLRGHRHSDAGPGHWGEHRPFFRGEWGVAQSAGVSPCRPTRRDLWKDPRIRRGPDCLPEFPRLAARLANVLLRRKEPDVEGLASHSDPEV